MDGYDIKSLAKSEPNDPAKLIIDLISHIDQLKTGIYKKIEVNIS